MAHQMVGDYLVIDHPRDEENRRHMLLRSYQVHALRAVEQAAYQGVNGDGVPHGGFVWHTTGERVIIVMGAIYVIKSRVSETLTKYNSCIA